MCSLQSIYFNVDGSVHRNNILIYIQQDATLHTLFYLEYALHVSGGTSIHHQERKNCIYSIWYISHRNCYLSLSWKRWKWFECAVGGVLACATRSTLKPLKYYLERKYKSLSSSLYHFLHWLFTTSLLGQNILLNTLFSNTLSLHDTVIPTVDSDGSLGVLTGLLNEHHHYIWQIFLFPLWGPRILLFSVHPGT